ncbi:MAG: HDOD domain-containing protein [Planctomycetota bacterium]|jgi:HD-like signal output (HDOD) protein|nr:HDOD domain-containing protein [Planctomycetota bacterium]
MLKDTEALVNNIIDLPTLPQVITTLMTLLDDPQSSIRDINNIMGKDQALVAKILKLVNSAFYAIPTRVSSISQAITILGFKTVKSIVLSAGVIGMFDSDSDDFSYQEFWINSLGVATISRFIIMRLSTDPLSGCAAIHPDTAFVAGLLNGIGKVVLDQYANEEFEAIIEKAKAEGLSFRDAERSFISGSYADVGFWLAKRWNLSEDIQTPLKCQDRLYDCPLEHRGMAAVLSLAKYLCRLKRFGRSGDFDHPPAPKAAVQILALTKETLPTVTSGLAEEFEKANSFLSMVRG